MGNVCQQKWGSWILIKTGLWEFFWVKMLDGSLLFLSWLLQLQMRTYDIELNKFGGYPRGPMADSSGYLPSFAPCVQALLYIVLASESWPVWSSSLQLVVLRVSSLVRFYKSRFWFFSENFLKHFWIKFLKYFWKISESRDFLLPTIQKWRKLAVLLLFSNCFSRILTNFRNFSENFQFFFRNFWKIISEKLCIQKFSAANHSKMKETSCFAAVFKLFCCYFHTFCVAFQAVLLLFSYFLRCFSRILTNFRFFSEFFQKKIRFFSEVSENFLKNFWKKIEIFLKNLWIQRFSAANHSKMKEISCFQSFQLVFHTFGSSQVPKVEEN